MKIAVFLLVSSVCVVCAVILLSGPEPEFFSVGVQVAPAPVGDLVAIGKKDGAWEVRDPSGKVHFTFNSGSPPYWVRKQDQLACVFKEGGSVKAVFHPSWEKQTLTQDQRMTPASSLGAGRVLLKGENESGTFGFALFDVFDPQGLKMHRIHKKGALGLNASRCAQRISYVAPDNDFYQITVLKQTQVGSYNEEQVIKDVVFKEHFWSKSSRFLLFSSCDGGIEAFDFQESQRKWIVEGGFSPCKILPYWARFHGDGRRVFAEREDRQGYRQITTWDLELNVKSEKHFTTGWLDHYGPVLSNDENSRYLIYRQGELPSMETQSERFEEKEVLYLFDFALGESRRLGDRAMAISSYGAGPCFSGDLEFVYFADQGSIFRTPLK